MKNERNKTNTNETPALRRPGQSVLAALCSNKTTIGALALLLTSGFSVLAVESGTDNRAPEVPEEIAVGSTNRVHFHGFAIGVQIYTWDGISWGRAVPMATLFDDESNIVATHFAGPTWQSNSGSKVLGAVVQPTVTVDTNSIPWVRLVAVTSCRRVWVIWPRSAFQRITLPVSPCLMGLTNLTGLNLSENQLTNLVLPPDLNRLEFSGSALFHHAGRGLANFYLQSSVHPAFTPSLPRPT